MAQLNDVGAGIFNHVRSNNVNRSRFDLSRVTNFTCDSGMIIPFDWFETLPGDTFDLSAEVALETLPTITNVLTPYKVKIHWYYLRNSDLWAGWDTFITKGRNGNVNLKLPKISLDSEIVISKNNSQSQFTGYYLYSPHSLASFLGCPSAFIGDYNNYLPYIFSAKDYSDFYPSYETVNLNALPFMAYQNIVKYNYVNQNLLQDNYALFPVEGDSDWRLPYNITTSSITTVSGKFINDFKYSSDLSLDLPILKDPCIYGSDDGEVLLGALRYAQFDDDYFTSGMPWLQRGTVHSTNIDFTNVTMNLFKNDLWSSDMASGSLWTSSDFEEAYQLSSSNGSLQSSAGYFSGDPVVGVNYDSIANGLVARVADGSSVQGSFTANQLRELVAFSVWQERNARVNGSYNSMIWVHWNTNPNEKEHKAQFIGGSSSYVNFSEVLQTSQSTSGSNGSPLGSVAGLGKMYDKSSYGRFDCTDYGIIMGILIITPITTYNTAIDHNFICADVMEDYPQPEFESLSPQPILNKELFYTGDPDVDDDLFSYQERYTYYKTRQNVNRGLFSSPSAKDTLFSSASQSREFSGIPKFSYEFVVESPENTRRDWLAYPSQPMFKVQVASHIDAVRPLSYAVQPNTFGF